MAYTYYLSDHFIKQLASYRKKYRHIIDDVENTLKSFDKQRAISLGSNVYKIRFRSSDIARGKSHAFRMVIYVVEVRSLISPLIIYFKGDKENIKKEEILYHKNIIEKIIEKELGIQ